MDMMSKIEAGTQNDEHCIRASASGDSNAETSGNRRFRGGHNALLLDLVAANRDDRGQPISTQASSRPTASRAFRRILSIM